MHGFIQAFVPTGFWLLGLFTGGLMARAKAYCHLAVTREGNSAMSATTEEVDRAIAIDSKRAADITADDELFIGDVLERMSESQYRRYRKEITAARAARGES